MPSGERDTGWRGSVIDHNFATPAATLLDMSPQQHGTYFESDGSKAEFADAKATWIPIAHEILVQTAGSYNRTITYKELTEAVQQRSGIRTRTLISNWIGQLLEQVAIRAADAGEPPLTSLCVHQDGTIGKGYQKAPKSVPSDPDTDVDDLAAEHRLLCYRRYADDLPVDGGSVTLTRQVAAARTRSAKPDVKPSDICPDHFMERSVTGVCWQCE